MTDNRNPMQPVYKDDFGRMRFKSNEIVRFLLDNGGFDMNDLAAMEFSQDDETQFAQLIGYSVCGFHELSYVSDAAAKRASDLVKEIDPKALGGCRDSGCEIHCGVEEE